LDNAGYHGAGVSWKGLYQDKSITLGNLIVSGFILRQSISTNLFLCDGFHPMGECSFFRTCDSDRKFLFSAVLCRN